MGKEKREKREEARETKREEKAAAATPCAREKSPVSDGRESLPAVIDVKTPPSLELLLAYAHVKLGFFDDAFTREWFRQMRDVYMWIHPKTDRPVRHWPVLFCKWIANRAAIDEARDPHRGPGARENARRRLSNHVDITKEERDDLLGKCGF